MFQSKEVYNIPSCVYEPQDVCEAVVLILAASKNQMGSSRNIGSQALRPTKMECLGWDLGVRSVLLVLKFPRWY